MARSRGRGGSRGGSRGGAKRGGPRGGGGVNSFRGTPQKSAFSLKEEASHTGHSRAFWNGDTKLRHQPLTFVPSTPLEATLKDNNDEQPQQEDEAKEEYGDHTMSEAPRTRMIHTVTVDDANTAVNITSGSMARLSLQPESISTMPVPQTRNSVPQQSSTASTTLTLQNPNESHGAPVIASLSSDSEEDKVVFKGRNNQKTAPKPAPTFTRPTQSAPLSSKPILAELSDVERMLRIPTTRRPTAQNTASNPSPSAADARSGLRHAHSRPTQPLTETASRSTVAETPAWDVGSTPWEHGSKPGFGWSKDYVILEEQRRAKKAEKEREPIAEAQMKLLEQQEKEREEEAIMADYIANMDAQEKEESLSTFQSRPLGGNDGLEVNFGGDNKQTVYVEQQDAWSAEMLRDFDEHSTSDDMTGDVQHVIGRRHRKRGLQYLIVYEDTSVDEARWVPATFLTRQDERALAEAFEAQQSKIAADAAAAALTDDEDSDGIDSDENNSDLYDSEESSEDDEAAFRDEEDLIQRRKDRLTDEQIARMLAKQEHLGIAGDDLEIFDGEFAGVDEDSDYGSIDPTFQFAAFTATPKSKGKMKGKGRKKEGIFPDATLFADVIEQDPYNGFDIMDFERPSLRPRKKGRRGGLDLEISDEELKAKLKSQWEQDRKTKAIKKSERQELRAKGLLGKKNKFKLDTEALVGEEMPWHEIRDTIISFILSSEDSFTFPPGLSKSDRAFVHDVAGLFQLSSRSKGADKANNRRTTIERLPTTVQHGTSEYDFVCQRISTQFFMRDNVTPNRGALRFSKVRGKKGGRKEVLAEKAEYSKTTYRSGEVIGSKAPEIGIENKGRALLEKMGWTKGQALGAENNPGLLDPIQHIFKTGKAGLR